jgi:hypothetical protein
MRVGNCAILRSYFTDPRAAGLDQGAGREILGGGSETPPNDGVLHPLHHQPDIGSSVIHPCARSTALDVAQIATTT